MFPLEFQGEVKRQETRVMVLLCGEGCVILTSTVFDWSTRVMDGQTDGQKDGRTGDSIKRGIAYMLSCANNNNNMTIFKVHNMLLDITRGPYRQEWQRRSRQLNCHYAVVYNDDDNLTIECYSSRA